MFDGRTVVTINQQGTLGQPKHAIVFYMLDGAVPTPTSLIGVIPTPGYDRARIAWVDEVGPSLVDAIWVVDLADEIGPHPLGLDVPRAVARLNWAPDGSRIVFDSRGQIVTRSLDISGETVVLTAGPSDRDPVYSPDGAFIYFIRNGAFYRMNADGTNAMEIVPAAQFGASGMDVR
jgi:dipeptidyl aminopeptidase/acylaminoacyl peptidase